MHNGIELKSLISLVQIQLFNNLYNKSPIQTVMLHLTASYTQYFLYVLLWFAILNIYIFSLGEKYVNVRESQLI